MSEQQPDPSQVSAQIETTIADYLQAHPDYFERHLELLDTLRIPHPCRPAVSLIERQLLRLREQNGQLRKRLLDLVDVARNNDNLAKRVQRLALALLEARDTGDVARIVQDVLRDEFNADFTAIKLAPQGVQCGMAWQGELLTPDGRALFEPMLRTGKPICGRLSGSQAQHLFDSNAARLGSAVVLPLQGAGWQGLLAVGSCNQQRFYPGMGVAFIRRMAELIGQALDVHLCTVVETTGS